MIKKKMLIYLKEMSYGIYIYLVCLEIIMIFMIMNVRNLFIDFFE